MIDKYTPRYSNSSFNMKSSVIRDMMKFSADPDMISFAGGLPGAEAFPITELNEIINTAIAKYGSSVFQYGNTEGHAPLRESICSLMKNTYGISPAPDNILVSSGSQQALYLLCKVMVNPGDSVITETPTFVGAISTFRSFMADIHTVNMDRYGMIPDELEEKVNHLVSTGNKPEFIYTIPSIHNPTGVTMNTARRRDIYEIASRYNLMIVEDDPYGMIRYDNLRIKPVKHLDIDERVVYLGSFSKTISPGLRTGWMAAQKEIARRCTIAKQGEDTCCNTLSQFIINDFIESGSIYTQIDKVREIYRKKRDIMTSAIDRFIPSASYIQPDGGLFLWLRYPEKIDTGVIHKKSLERNIAYVPGNAFYPGGGGASEMRLNFSFPSIPDIEEGIRRLGAIIDEELKDIH